MTTTISAAARANAAVRDALAIAHAMLVSIERGNTYSTADWDQSVGVIERALGMDTLRATLPLQPTMARTIARRIATGRGGLAPYAVASLEGSPLTR